ncbi:MAG: tRNA 2-thiouridine(34) synthase MnmA, partial [bacterium]|nr:tRNA 2-thiouridine(34) synthase MnmA [bacterium]
GRTPNPCTRCNPKLKFGFMLKKARQTGIHFDAFATGHYIRTCFDTSRNRHVLKKAIDPKKDQSYFLYALAPELLSNLLFPLGGFTKDEVRRQAAALNLPVSKRPESQDFIEGGNYAALFNSEDIAPGPIVDTDGKNLGTHKGIINYTIGQRRGIGIAHSEPLYVISIDAPHNTLVVGPKPHLFSDTLIAGDLHFLSCDPPDTPLPITAKIRHNHRADSARLTLQADGKARLVFERPQLSITPGQAVVFYNGDIVLGGGVIEKHFLNGTAA